MYMCMGAFMNVSAPVCGNVLALLASSMQSYSITSLILILKPYPLQRGQRNISHSWLNGVSLNDGRGIYESRWRIDFQMMLTGNKEKRERERERKRKKRRWYSALLIDIDLLFIFTFLSSFGLFIFWLGTS